MYIATYDVNTVYGGRTLYTERRAVGGIHVVQEASAGPRARSSRRAWVGVDPRDDVPPRPPLTRANVVRAALLMVDDQGLNALTMRALAQQLDVSTMALYNHVRDKEELVDLMVDLMLGEVDCSPTEGHWQDQLRSLIRSYHQALSSHRGLARVYSFRVRIGPHGLMVMERTLQLLTDAGFARAAAADAFFTLFTYTVGYHQMGRVEPLDAQSPDGESGYYLALPPEEIPTVTRLAQHLGGAHQAGRFERGLDTLLAGLEAIRHRADPRSVPQTQQTG